jgi:peroxiredoxin
MPSGLIKHRVIILTFLALMLTFGCSKDDPEQKLNPPDATDVDKNKPITDSPVSLQSKLDSMKNRFESKATDDKKKDYAQGVKEVDDLGLTKTALNVGDEAYKFDLPGASGSNVKLDELLKDGPVVVMWYRGGWCPYCNVQLREMQSYLPQIKELGANLVAISPEIPDSSLSTKQKDELSYYVLSDIGNEVARKYGIVYTLPEVVQKQFEGRLDVNSYNGDTKKELPLAVTYVIDKNGKITYAFLDTDYKKEPSPKKY